MSSKIKTDYTGLKIGDWNIVEYISIGKYVCVCDNGHKSIRSAYDMKKGRLRGCKDCIQIVLIGKKFDNYTVLKYTHTKGIKLYFDCECKCGQVKNINHFSLLYRTAVGCRNCIRKLPQESEAFNGLYSAYRTRAARRKISFELTHEQFRELTQMNCHYTGMPPSFIFKKRHATYTYNGLDRLNSSIGYTIDNVVPCNGYVNQMKMDIPYNEFIELCALIIKHVSEKNKNISLNKLVAV